MIIYGDNKELLSFNEALGKIESLINSLEFDRYYGHNPASELLITTGEFEAALTDLLCPEVDSMDDLINLLRSLSLASAHIFINQLKRNPAETNKWIAAYREKLPALKNYGISSLLSYNVPEGYAFYSLYPEMYLKSADNFFNIFFPSEVTVIGIRSIGTSLSAVVAARLEESGSRVKSLTIRPRGFYFDRKLIIDMELEEELKASHKGYYLVVDEGPGLSGSSFASVAEKLSSLGISDDRIVFFPGHRTDGQNFVSEKAKAIWMRHMKFHSEFEEVISIRGLFPEYAGEVKDISAGMWRNVVFKNAEEFPPVFPNFEQRKYLSHDHKYIIKFAGLGHYGRDLFERAEVLFSEGFSPQALALENGFILSRFIGGKPLSASDVNISLLDRAASYVAFLKRSFPASCSRTYNEIEEMISVNLMKGLGDEWSDKFSKLSSSFKPFFSTNATALDGRMLPFEWLKINGDYIKTDSIHHHKDHFFPGCQDIAYDIAGFITEFLLGKDEEHYFINSYIKQSGDKEIESRLPFYFVFYNAFRLGLTQFSAQMSLDQDKQKFNALANQYAMNLKQRLLNAAATPWY
ncbi:MAG: hypothetical protein ACM3UR_13185 [Bacteroidota bacterium]|jgi:hypothetical protein|nr:hypothetical protein [Ignavibacteria bacterium]MCU7524012.1 hypothetical protein [Ignavibacteria bacterium]